MWLADLRFIACGLFLIATSMWFALVEGFGFDDGGWKLPVAGVVCLTGGIVLNRLKR